MLQKLPLTVEPVDRETLPSFFSRMAALNGTDVIWFAQDIGISFKGILDQEEVAAATFAAKAGLSPDRFGKYAVLDWRAGWKRSNAVPQ